MVRQQFVAQWALVLGVREGPLRWSLNCQRGPALGQSFNRQRVGGSDEKVKSTSVSIIRQYNICDLLELVSIHMLAHRCDLVSQLCDLGWSAANVCILSDKNMLPI